MGENLASGLLYDIIEPTTQLDVDSNTQRSIPTFNKATAVAALSSSTLVSTMKKPLNKCNSATLMFLFSVIGLSLLSLSVMAIVIGIVHMIRLGSVYY